MILAIDFDNVLCNSHNVKPGFRMGEPMEGAVESMQRLKRKGNTLIIHTIRGDRPDHVANWLKHFGIPYDQITNVKPNADWFIDDKAIPFTSWAELIL